MSDVAELERRRALRGQAGRQPARRLASHLRAQGFLPTTHFLQRFVERLQARGMRFEPRAFGRAFDAARHARQTRAGYTTRLAWVWGVPVVYRVGGQAGNRIVLVGLLPAGATPPSEPIRPPRREAESEHGLAVATELAALGELESAADLLSRHARGLLPPPL